ncbi:MAG: ATP-binding cassette domain-containing protein [Candidatus Competibacteraceae bacterium]|nr:MAG: ATP-binding cassette domain-containing protein [Candidatus Competibacteraceae bacterium]
MPELRLEAVTHPVLGPLDLTVADGEAVAVLGPSGAGKNTLLKIIAGLLPYQGRLTFDGVSMAGVPAYRRNIGYLSQDLHLFPHLSVENNIRLALLFDRTSVGQRRERTRQILNLCAIAHRAQRRPQTLSGGERQRAALARALARHPRLLLLDEPFSRLDRSTKQILWTELGTLRRHLGLTALIVTHDAEEAVTLADRVIILQAGLLLPAAATPPWDT